MGRSSSFPVTTTEILLEEPAISTRSFQWTLKIRLWLFFILVIIALMFEERFYCKLPTITVLNGKSAHKFLHPSLNLCFYEFLIVLFVCFLFSLLYLLSRAALFVSLSFSNSNCCFFLSLSLEFSNVTTLSLFISCALLSFQACLSFALSLKCLLSLS